MWQKGRGFSDPNGQQARNVNGERQKPSLPPFESPSPVFQRGMRSQNNQEACSQLRILSIVYIEYRSRTFSANTLLHATIIKQTIGYCASSTTQKTLTIELIHLK